MGQPDPFAEPAGAVATVDPFGEAADDPFSNPAPAGGKAPRVMDLPGRLVLIRPCSATTETVAAHPSEVKKNPGATQQRMTADLIVLDGGTINFGGKPENGTPHTLSEDAPAIFRRVWFNQVAIVSGCMRTETGHVRFGSKKPFAIGRFVKGVSKDGGFPPWLLKTDTLTPADLQLARAWIQANPDDVFGG